MREETAQETTKPSVLLITNSIKSSDTIAQKLKISGLDVVEVENEDAAKKVIQDGKKFSAVLMGNFHYVHDIESGKPAPLRDSSTEFRQSSGERIPLVLVSHDDIFRDKEEIQAKYQRERESVQAAAIAGGENTDTLVAAVHRVLNPKTILLIDDNEGNRYKDSAGLERAGFKVVIASTIEEGKQLVHNAHESGAGFSAIVLEDRDILLNPAKEKDNIVKEVSALRQEFTAENGGQEIGFILRSGLADPNIRDMPEIIASLKQAKAVDDAVDYRFIKDLVHALDDALGNHPNIVAYVGEASSLAASNKQDRVK